LLPAAEGLALAHAVKHVELRGPQHFMEQSRRFVQFASNKHAAAADPHFAERHVEHVEVERGGTQLSPTAPSLSPITSAASKKPSLVVESTGSSVVSSGASGVSAASYAVVS
jgi:hypothetical protein